VHFALSSVVMLNVSVAVKTGNRIYVFSLVGVLLIIPPFWGIGYGPSLFGVALA